MTKQIKSSYVKLAELVQKKYKMNIESYVMCVVGKSPNQTILVSVVLPSDERFVGKGSSKHNAREVAAEEALVYFKQKHSL